MQSSRATNLVTSAVAVLLLQASLAPLAWSQAYSFRSIADTEGAFTNFGGAPVINNAGDVAFVASLDSGVRGIFFGPSPISDTIVDDQGPYDGFNYPSINDDGDVAFRAFVDPSDEHFFGGSGIFTGDDPEEDFVALHLVPNSPPDPWGSFDAPSINNKGTVAFGAIRASGGFGIYTGNDPEEDKYADDSLDGPFTLLFGASINDEGTVAFFAELEAGGGGIFIGDDVPADTIVDSSGPYSAFGNPAINNHGVVAFMAQLDAGGEGVFTGPNPSTDAVATTAGPYSNFIPDISINNNGDVVFAADLDAGGFGIFTGPNPVADKVIAEGDELFGSEVTFVSLFTENINDNGEVSFMYELEDGRVGVAVASPGALVRTIDQGDDYDDVRLISAAGADTVARLRHGTAEDDRNVSLSFAPGGSFSINGSEPVGDVLDLSGTADDMFVLEFTYSDDDLLAAGVQNETNLVIQWRDPDDNAWKNAVLGNEPPGGDAYFGLSFDEYLSGSGIVELGAYGNDPDSNTVWAVLNHNSLFAISAAAAVPAVLGDYNQNGVVDAADYVVWRDRLGSLTSLPNDPSPGVGQDDYARWRSQFGRTSAAGSGASATSLAPVPEPTSVYLLLLVLVACRVRRAAR